MPIWADPKRGETVRLLADDDMTLLATFVAPPGEVPTAADVRLVDGADPARFAHVACRDLPGVRLITRVDEAAALAASGATVVSSAVHMVRAHLQEDPPPLRWAAPRLPGGISLTGLERSAGEIVTARRLVGSSRMTVDGLAGLLAGETMGPVYDDASALLVTGDGLVAGAVVVTLWEAIGDEWAGGPWVSELFRLPAAGPGLVGRGLLARAVVVAHLDGHDSIGVTVDSGDRACARLYRRLGFEPAFHRVTLDLPGSWPAAP